MSERDGQPEASISEDFVPTGSWWTRPLWQKALIWLALRPLCWLRGEWAQLRQQIALRRPTKPFAPLAWVVTAEKPMCEQPDEIHMADCRCAAGASYAAGKAHGLAYERDDVRWVGDDFDLRVGRTYSFTPED